MIAIASIVLQIGMLNLLALLLKFIENVMLRELTGPIKKEKRKTGWQRRHVAYVCVVWIYSLDL